MFTAHQGFSSSFKDFVLPALVVAGLVFSFGAGGAAMVANATVAQRGSQTQVSRAMPGTTIVAPRKSAMAQTNGTDLVCQPD